MANITNDTPDNMGRPVRADEPQHHTGYLYCPDCQEMFDEELFPIIRGCWEHEDRLEELRERAFELWKEVQELKVRLTAALKLKEE